MKLRKRPIPHDASDVETKKRRSDCPSIEDLPSEIWFEIFAYFDGPSLLDSFSPLNSFFQSLLNDIRLRISFDLNATTRSSLQLFHSNQISSFTIDYASPHIDENLRFDSFLRLRSLRLINVKEKHLQHISELQLKTLLRLAVHSKCAKYLLKIVAVYFPSIEHIELHALDQEFLLKCFNLEKQLSRVKHLRLNGTIQLSKLFRLWPWVPHLESLSMIGGGVHQCDYWIENDSIYQNALPPNLFRIHVRIFDDDLSFNNLERLTGKSLRYVKISGSMADDDLDEYLSSEHWIRFILRCSDQFESIQLDLSSYYDPGDPIGLQKMLNRFRQNAFFRHCKIKSENYFITIRGRLR